MSTHKSNSIKKLEELHKHIPVKKKNIVVPKKEKPIELKEIDIVDNIKEEKPPIIKYLEDEEKEIPDEKLNKRTQIEIKDSDEKSNSEVRTVSKTRRVRRSKRYSSTPKSRIDSN